MNTINRFLQRASYKKQATSAFPVSQSINMKKEDFNLLQHSSLWFIFIMEVYPLSISEWVT